MSFRLKDLIVTLALALTPAPRAEADPLKGLAKTLGQGLPAGVCTRVAVLDFLYPDGTCPAGCALVRERLTTYLAARPGIVLVERSLLDTVAKELQLEASGMVALDQPLRLGELLQTDALVLGTLHDLPEDRAEVNARLIHTQSGRILAADLAMLKRTWPEHHDARPALAAPAQAPRPIAPAAAPTVAPRRRQSLMSELSRTPPASEEQQLRFFIGEK